MSLQTDRFDKLNFSNIIARNRTKFSEDCAHGEAGYDRSAILNALQAKGRMSNAALAEKVGLSASACSRRLDHSGETGVDPRVPRPPLQCRARLSDDGHRPYLAVRTVRQDAGRVRSGREALSECAVMLSDVAANTTTSSGSRPVTSPTTNASTRIGCRPSRTSSRSTRPLPCARSSTVRTSASIRNGRNGNPAGTGPAEAGAGRRRAMHSGRAGLAA